MYQVTVKGRTLSELKIAVRDIHSELTSGKSPVNGLEKDLTTNDVFFSDKPTMELAEDEVEIQSPYSDATPAQIAPDIAAALAPPVAPAHITQAVAPVAEVADGEGLDAEGLPWDKRINTDSKMKIKAGSWKIKRGLDAAVVAQIKAELKQAIHLQANPIAIPAAPINAATPAVAMVPEVIAPVAPPVAVAPVALPVAAVAPTPLTVTGPPIVAPIAPPMVQGGHTLASFKANMAMTIGTLITEGKLTQDYVNTLKAHFSVAEIWQVSEAQMEEMFTTFVSHSIISQVG